MRNSGKASPPHQALLHKVLIDVIDVEIKETVSTQEQLVGPDSGFIHVGINKECLKCVVTVTPILEAKTNPCTAFIAPFSTVNNSKAPQRFHLELSQERCRAPEGIDLASKGSNGWKIAVVIVAVLFVAAIIVGIIVFVVLRKKKHEKNGSSSLNQIF